MPRAVSLAGASRLEAEWATGMKPLPALRRGTRLSSRAACSFNSFKTSEPCRTAITGRVAAFGLGDQSYRRFVAATAVPNYPGDIPFARPRHLVPRRAASRGLSGPVAGDGRDHHAMARPRRRGSRALDHGADRSRDERHPQDDHPSLHLALRTVGHAAELSGRHGQLLRTPAGVRAHRGPELACRRDAVGGTALFSVGLDLSLRAGKRSEAGR